MKRTLKIAIPAIILVLLFSLLCSCASAPVEPGEVRAEIAGDSINITAAFTEQVVHANEGKNVCLFELENGKTIDSLQSLKPIAECAIAESVSFSVPLSKNGATRLISGFVLATYDAIKGAYSPIYKNVFYVSNPEALASDIISPDDPSSIKGVAAESIAHTIALGASNALIDLPLENYLVHRGGSATVRHDFLGESFYFSAEAMRALEKDLSSLEGAECAVYLRVCLKTPAERLSAELAHLSYPGTEAGQSYYQINFGNESAFKAYAAFVDYIVKNFDTAQNIIVGKAQNSPNLGDDTADFASGAYVAEYAAALRVTENIAKSTRAYAQVFAAVDNYMTSAKNQNAYSAKDFLKAIAACSTHTDNYDWGVAAECVPAIVDSDSVWYDTENNSTLTPTNLSYFTDVILADDSLLYEDWTRNVIISDFAVSAKKGDPASAARQAASYAYTYYEAAKTDKISAFIYSSIFDTESKANGIVSGSTEKDIYSMIRRIDTNAPIGDEVGEVVGQEWSELYMNEELRAKVAKGKYSTGSAKVGTTDGLELSPVIDFNGGTLCGFETAGSGYVSLSRVGDISVLSAHFDPENTDAPYAVSAGGIAPELFDGDKLVLNVKAAPKIDAPAGNYKLTLTLLQRNANGESAVYTSSATISSNTDSAVLFDISEFSKSKTGDDVTLMLTVDSDFTLPFTLTLTSVISARSSSNVLLVVLLIILGVLLLGGLITVFVFWFRKNYTIDFGGKKKSKKQKKTAK